MDARTLSKLPGASSQETRIPTILPEPRSTTCLKSPTPGTPWFRQVSGSMILCNALLGQFLASNITWSRLDCFCAPRVARGRFHCLAQNYACYHGPKPFHTLIAEIPKLWFPCSLSDVCRRSGHDRGFTARRPNSETHRRWKSALFRARKICRLARNLTSAHTSRMPAVTGVLPSATYSSKLLGMAKQLDRLRTATWNAIMPRKGGRCRTMTLGHCQRVSLAYQSVLSTSARG